MLNFINITPFYFKSVIYLKYIPKFFFKNAVKFPKISLFGPIFLPDSHHYFILWIFFLNFACERGKERFISLPHFLDSLIMVMKTRDKFIEVARQLFARKGVENTTMNDIATASDKGRRTIYTYFRSKRDIFNAVIESETDQLLGKLRHIAAQIATPEQKLQDYIDCRFEAVKEIVSRNGSLRAGFFRDVRKVDRARKTLTRKETALLRDILQEGVDQGCFAISNVAHFAAIITQCIHGLDVPYIRDNLSDEGIDKSELKKYLSELILDGIKSK